MTGPLVVLAALVLERWPNLSWRHHGIGVLQAYVREGDDPEVRVHVWHPDLVRPGLRDAGDIHDHRFDLGSTVLIGGLWETFYGRARPDPDGKWSVFHVENARSAGPERNFDGDCYVIDADARFAVEAEEHRRLPAGMTYWHPRATFHRTIVDELAVTVCVMREKRGSARLLVPHGREPVHAFGAPASAWLQSQILDEASAALVRLVRGERLR